MSLKNDHLTIFFVSNNYTPYSGGVVSSIDASMEQLRAQNHQVHLITLDFGVAAEPKEHLHRIACHIKFQYKKNHMAVPLLPYYALNKLIQHYKPDIIHTHHPFLLGVSARNLAQHYKIPIVFTHHTLYEEYLHYVPFPKNITRSIVHKLVYSFCNSVDAIVAPSTTIKKYLEKQHITTPITVIPSGILPIFAPKQKSTKTTGKKLNIITVSRFVPEKNITFLFDALSHLDPQLFTFTLIGFGPELSYLQDYAYNHCHFDEQIVQFVIQPPKVKIAQYYKEADLFLFASKTETQGLVLAEAMAHATPVIALEGPAIADIIESEINGYIVQTPQEMASRIQHIAHNHRLLEALQNSAWHTAQRYFPGYQADQLIHLYKHMRNHL